MKKDALSQLDINSIKGLSEAEAQKKQSIWGFNELPQTNNRNTLTIGIEVIKEPMFLLLVICGSLYFLLGDIREAAVLVSFVFVIMGITIRQERKTEKTLEALRDLSSPRALVIRDSEYKRIAGREVVKDDYIVLSEGDRVPADAALIWCGHFMVDESLLTGESIPVKKKNLESGMVDSIQMARPGGEDSPFVFSGTLIIQGQGIAKVKAIGAHTEIGKIGKELKEIEPEKTHVQKETAKFVKEIATIGFAFFAILVLIYGITRGNWIEGILAGITLTMAMLPEEFPVVLTVFFALGAWRISQKRVLTRRMPAIETLGAATVLCTDKTGTLTLNKMKVNKIFANGQFLDLAEKSDNLPENFHELIEFSILASQREPFDPMEKELKRLAEYSLSNTEHLHNDWMLVQEYPLSRDLFALSHVWKSPSGEDYVIASKGSPEGIADLCHFNHDQTRELLKNISFMAEEGMRVIGVAKASFNKSELPPEQHEFNFHFIGLIGMSDPVRETVPESIKECYGAGVRVIMITGDYPGTAKFIAKQIGLNNSDEVIAGQELHEMSDSELRFKIKTCNIFARVVPEQKLKIVEALKANGEIVAMTGDGVNDAPALKAANIGIAMGGRGTDVAREASALVLLDDDFSSIVEAIKGGRRIFDNLKKAISYIFAVHVPIVGMSLIPVFMNWPLVLFPVHIAFLELIIDPACSVVFEAEPEEKDVMSRPPRDPKEPLFNRNTVGVSILQGLSVLLIVLVVYRFALLRGHLESDARALAFLTMVFANLCLIFTNRSWTRTIFQTLKVPNLALWIVSSGTLIFLGIVLYVPFFQSLFHFSALHPIDLLVCFVAGLLGILWFEAIKVFRSRSIV